LTSINDHSAGRLKNPLEIREFPDSRQESMPRPFRAPALRRLAALAGLVAFGFAGAVPAAHDGDALYAQHCSACHGSDGHGGVGVPLALPDFLATVDDSYLRKSIRHGRPGRVMPPFPELSDAQINSIVRHIRSWQKGAQRAAVKVGPGNPAAGEKLFLSHCASCHGEHGEGSRGTGVTFSRPRDLPILAPALNNPGFHAAITPALIKATLVYGREGTPMGSFLKQGLSEKEIDDVVAYVRRLGEMRPPASAKVLASESAVLVRQSPYDLPTTVDKVKNALAGASMRLIRAAAFDEHFVAKDKENPKRVALDACDFSFLNQALAVDPRVGLFLPCRITVTEHAGKVLVMTINPKRLSAIFNNSELNELCEKMHQVYNDILDEATL
jgi:cytochrome c oxidase cbb3-type subunit 3